MTVLSESHPVNYWTTCYAYRCWLGKPCGKCHLEDWEGDGRI